MYVCLCLISVLMTVHDDTTEGGATHLSHCLRPLPVCVDKQIGFLFVLLNNLFSLIFFSFKMRDLSCEGFTRFLTFFFFFMRVSTENRTITLYKLNPPDSLTFSVEEHGLGLELIPSPVLTLSGTSGNVYGRLT